MAMACSVIFSLPKGRLEQGQFHPLFCLTPQGQRRIVSLLPSVPTQKERIVPNIEIKARYNDHDKARKIANQLNAKFLWRDVQVDTYFVTSAGKLKLRESTHNGNELIPYMKDTSLGPKKSDYLCIPISDVDRIRRLFTDLLGVRVLVKKTREVYLLDNVRIHLDEVEGLGKFLEFEAVFDVDTYSEIKTQTHRVRELMAVFGIMNDSLEEGSYPELVQRNNV